MLAELVMTKMYNNYQGIVHNHVSHRLQLVNLCPSAKQLDRIPDTLLIYKSSTKSETVLEVGIVVANEISTGTVADLSDVAASTNGSSCVCAPLGTSKCVVSLKGSSDSINWRSSFNLIIKVSTSNQLSANNMNMGYL